MSLTARIVAAMVAALALVGLGWRLGIDHMKAKAKDADEVRQETIKAADEGAARAISKLEVKNVTIRQQTQTIVRDVPVYRECRHDQRVLDNINAALVGDQPAGPGQLPAASAPGR